MGSVKTDVVAAAVRFPTVETTEMVVRTVCVIVTLMMSVGERLDM